MTLAVLFDAVVNGEAATVENEVRAALAANTPADAILNDTLIPAMREVGRLFEQGEFFVPEMLAAAQAMKAGLVILKTALATAGHQPKYTLVIGTVKGDMHDIGKNLVAMMMEGAGFRVIDLGVDVPPEKFVEAVQGDVQVVGVSALLTTTMRNMAGVLQALQAAGLRDKVKVLVGGAPVTQWFADQIGADGYAPDASTAVRRALELLSIKP